MPREPITARLVADILEAAGVDRVLTMDLHAGQVQGFFHKPVDHMTAVPILAEHFSMLLDLEADEIVVVSADAGRVKLAKKFAEMLGGELALITKERPEHQEAEATNVIGRVRGKVCILLDDMIDTAGTLCAGGQALLRPRRDARLRMRDAPRVLGPRARAARVERVREGGGDETPSRSTRRPAPPTSRCCRWPRSWLIRSRTSSTTIPSRASSTAETNCSDGPSQATGQPPRGARDEGRHRPCEQRARFPASSIRRPPTRRPSRSTRARCARRCRTTACTPSSTSRSTATARAAPC